MNFGKFSRALFEENHPYPQIALARAKMNVNQEGFGLTKIPVRVLEKYSSLLPNQYEAINDSVVVEARVLTEVDSLALAEEGLNESIQQHHVASDGVDRRYIANIKAGRRKKYISTDRNEYYDVEAEFEGILELVDEVYSEHGDDLDETSHVRLRNKIVSFMKRDA